MPKAGSLTKALAARVPVAAVGMGIVFAGLDLAGIHGPGSTHWPDAPSAAACVGALLALYLLPQRHWRTAAAGAVAMLAGAIALAPAIAALLRHSLPDPGSAATSRDAAGLAALAAGVAALCAGAQSRWRPLRGTGHVARAALIWLLFLCARGSLAGLSDARHLALPMFSWLALSMAASWALLAPGPQRGPLARPAPLASMATSGAAGIAALVLGGWLVQCAPLVQANTSFVPMQFNTALAVLLLAVGAQEGGSRLRPLLCLLPIAIACAGVMKELGLGRVDLDQLLFVHRITSESVPPGRVALASAVSLLFLGAAALLQALPQIGAPARLLAWAANLLALTIGTLSLCGYVLGLPLVRAWGASTPMALNTACAVMLLALGGLMRGLRIDRTYALRAAIVPIFAVLAVGAATTELWAELVRNSEQQRAARLEDLATRAGHAFARELEGRAAQLQALAAEMARTSPSAQAPRAPQEALGAGAAALWPMYPSLRALAWIDAGGAMRARLARDAGDADALALIDSARWRAPFPARRLSHAEEGLSLLALDAGGGRLLAAFDTKALLAALQNDAYLDGLARVVPSSRTGTTEGRVVEVLGQRWRVLPEAGADSGAYPVRESTLLLLGGLSVASLIAMVLRFGLLARGRALEVVRQSEELRTRNRLLQELGGGLHATAAAPALAERLREHWPDSAIGVNLEGQLATLGWPPDLDARQLLPALAGTGETLAQAEAQLRSFAASQRREVLRERIDAAEGVSGVLLVLRPQDEVGPDDDALLRSAADVVRVALARDADRSELRDLHRTYASLVAFHPDAVLELDRAGHVRQANAAALSLFDADLVPLKGRALGELIDPEQAPLAATRFAGALEGHPQSAEMRVLARGTRDMELTLVPLRRADAVDGAFALLHDVTRLRAADRALRQSHQHAQVFSRRLMALNECAVGLARLGERREACAYLARGLRDALDAGAVAVRLLVPGALREAPAELESLLAVRQRGATPPDSARLWFDQLGGDKEALVFDRDGLRERLLPGSLADAPALPQRNWLAIPLRTSSGRVLGRLELFDARAEDDFEDAYTIAAQFAQLGAASLERLQLIDAIRNAERDLIRQLAFTEAIAGSMSDAVYAVDRSGRLNYINSAAERMFGANGRIVQRQLYEMELTGSAQTCPAHRALAENAVVRMPEVELRHHGGSRFVASVSASPLALEGTVVGAVVVVRDVSERRRADALQRERDRFFELSLELFCIADTQGHFLQVNQAFGRTLGYTNEEILRQPWIDLVHPDDRAATQAAAEALYQSGRLTDFCNRYRHVNGSYRWLEWNGQRDVDGKVYATARDITERRRIESELSHHATHDSLTGLPNLEQQQTFLQGALASAATRGTRVAVFYIDIDHFHAINETRGHAAGDTVLREVALRLRDAAGKHGQVSRIAGDEFILVREEVADWVDQGELGEDLRARVEEPMPLDGQQFFLTCSIGVSCFPENGTTPTDLIRQAEAAMLRAKREGRNTVIAFSNDQLQLLLDRQRLGARLRDAIRDNELVLHYQPQISVHNWQVVGVESLVRWQSPELGLLLPGRFIQVAEEMGLIVEIGQWVLERACRQAKAWLDEGLAEFTVAVNVSGVQLQRPDFLERVRRALDASGLPPRYLELELTESILMEHVERVITTMRALKALGVMISLDDFGSGYSSLSYLRRFPIDKLKIDQTFVRDITSEANAAGICRAVIALGHQLGLTVSAEGVESIGQAGFLRRAECDQFQGNYFSLPLPAAQVFEVLRRRYINRERLAPIMEDQPAPRTILLLDDEENVLRALVRLLRRDNYNVLTATRPREALEILAANPVQVILSDQRMPEQSGTEFLFHVKEMYPDTVRLILSGYSDLASLTDAINRGAIYRYIAKPWDDEDLRRQIREAFRLGETRASAQAR